MFWVTYANQAKAIRMGGTVVVVVAERMVNGVQSCLLAVWKLNARA